MDYEKKYKEALEKAHKLCAYPTSKPFISDLQDLFPELKESEDERIRKEIINYFECQSRDEPTRKYIHDKWIAWLEKQGEQKPNYCHHEVDLSGCSEEYRKAYYDGWNNCNMQHSQCKSELDDVVKCLINGMKFYYEDNEEATWGTDKWSMPVKHIIEVLEKQGEQNLANSAKTCKVEQNPNNCVDYKDAIMHVVRHYVIPDEIDDELRRIAKGEWKYATWSEEDEAVLDALIRRLEGKDVYVSPHLAIECLKFLKDRVQSQPKQEWSEEDGKVIKDICDKLNRLSMTIVGNESKVCLDDINWLKSLKPQNRWKPSEEQIKALKEAVDEHFDIDGGALWHLYQELKNLKE